MDFGTSLNPSFISDGHFFSSTHIQCGTLRPKIRVSRNKASRIRVLKGKVLGNPLGPKHVSYFFFRALPKLHVAISGEVLPESSTLSKTTSSSKPLEMPNLGSIEFSNGKTSLKQVTPLEGGDLSSLESENGKSTSADLLGKNKMDDVSKKVDVSKNDDVSKIASALTKKTNSDMKKKIMKKYMYPNRVIRCLNALNKYSSKPEKDLETCLENFKGVLNGKDMVAVMKECSNGETALKFFRWCQQEEGLTADVIHYNVLVSKLGKVGELAAAEKLVKEMLTAGLKPDNYTCSSLVSTATRCGSPSTALNWFHKMQDEGVIPDQITYCSVINTLGRSGNIKKAMRLFIQMRKKGWKLDVSTYNVVMNLFVQSCKWNEAVTVLRDMELHGLKPDSASYSILISGFARANLTKQAHRFFNEMYEKDIEPSSIMVTAMITCFGKAGNIASALEVFELSKKKFGRHTALYNSILRICISYGLFNKVEEIFHEMEKAGAVPDDFTTSIMIRLFAETGRVEKALELFKTKKMEGKVLHGADFAALVKGLGNSKNFGQVERIFKELPEESSRWVSDSLSLGQLLKVLSLCQNAEEAGHILNCFKVVAPELFEVLTSPIGNFQVQDKKLIASDLGSPETLSRLQIESFLRSVSASNRNLICNLLINVLWNIGLQNRAGFVFYAGRATGAYKGIFTQNSEEMSLQLKTLTMGPCQVAVREWLHAMKIHFNSQEKKGNKFTTGNARKGTTPSTIFLNWGFVTGQELPELVRIQVGLQNIADGNEENEENEENGDDLQLEDNLGNPNVVFDDDLKVEVGRMDTKTEQNKETLSSLGTKPGNEVKLRSFRATVIEELKELGAPFKEERAPGRGGWLVAKREEVKIWLKDGNVGSYLKCRDSLLEAFERWPFGSVDRRGMEGEREKVVVNNGGYQTAISEIDG